MFGRSGNGGHARVTLLNEKNEVVARLGDDVARVTGKDGGAIRGDTKQWHPGKFVHPHDACFAHASQNPAGDFWTVYTGPMLRFRGMECGRTLAEAFVHHEQSPSGRLPT